MGLAPALFSSDKQDWQTPASFMACVFQVLDRAWLDPCTSDANPLGATEFFTPKTGGINSAWPDLDVFQNSPFGSAIKRWLCKWTMESVRHQKRNYIAICPARTDTTWFQRYGYGDSHAICKWRGRVTFNNALTGRPVIDRFGRDMPAPFPLAVLYRGPNVIRFEEVFRSKGTIITKRWTRC